MKKTLLTLPILTILWASIAQSAFAVCPVCTVAVGAGLGLSRYFGIDDTLSGVWVGGLILSSSLWLTDWLSKKKWLKKTRINDLIIGVLFYLLVVVPLWFAQIIGHPFNTILGIDKLVFGSLIGIVAFIFGIWADKYVRKLKGKILFPYQKVAFPVGALVIASLIMYFLTKQ